MKTVHLFCATLLLGFGSAATAADNAEFALRGETKAQVRSEYGEPESIKGPVGDPPITRWIYSDFTVVYEYDRVLHAFHRQPDVEKHAAQSAPPRPQRGDSLDIPAE